MTETLAREEALVKFQDGQNLPGEFEVRYNVRNRIARMELPQLRGLEEKFKLFVQMVARCGYTISQYEDFTTGDSIWRFRRKESRDG